MQEMAPAYGRNPADLHGGMLLFTAIAKDFETAKQTAIASLSRRYNQPFDTLVERYCALGTPQQCLEKIQAFMDAGMSHLIFSFTCPAEQVAEQIEQCAAEILPHLRQ
jgi:alkanesulfonate monooxygenase SsuD/methylene tetrahydromethanopterin reductase-like flavin-dependent oxidoreductase (luciferase family)